MLFMINQQALLLMMYIVSKKCIIIQGGVMMKMNDREEIYSYLKQYYREYSLAKNSEERDRIENNVRNFAEGLDDEIYLELNNNAASGLFAPGFFESDMDKSLRQLQNVKL